MMPIVLGGCVLRRQTQNRHRPKGLSEMARVLRFLVRDEVPHQLPSAMLLPKCRSTPPQFHAPFSAAILWSCPTADGARTLRWRTTNAAAAVAGVQSTPEAPGPDCGWDLCIAQPEPIRGAQCLHEIVAMLQ